MLTINTRAKKLFSDDEAEELVDLSPSFTPQKLEFVKAGGSYAIVFGKKLQTFAAEALGVTPTPVFAPSKIIAHDNQGLTAVEKIFNANAVGAEDGSVMHAGSDARVRVNIVGSQDTTGLMTAQELDYYLILMSFFRFLSLERIVGDYLYNCGQDVQPYTTLQYTNLYK